MENNWDLCKTEFRRSAIGSEELDRREGEGVEYDNGK